MGYHSCQLPGGPWLAALRRHEKAAAAQTVLQRRRQCWRPTISSPAAKCSLQLTASSCAAVAPMGELHLS